MDTIISFTEEDIFSFDLSAKSEAGIREENQDNYLLVYPDGKCEYLKNETTQQDQLSDWPIGCVRMVVVDGMGGHDFGRQAAEAVINELLELPFQSSPQELKEALLAIHKKLYKQFYQGAKTPGSTLVMADIATNGQATIANIGDSRIYLHSNQGWSQLSRDHTVIEFAYRDDEIKFDDYKAYVLQNTGQIAQAMGFGSSGVITDENSLKQRKHVENLRIDIGLDIKTISLQEGDALLLASDGIWDNQEKYSPSGIDISTANNIIDNLFIRAKEYQSRDNITTLVGIIS